MMANFMSAEEATAHAQLRAAYGEERYDRLARIKRSYDPHNLFRMNHNIVPA
jgi:FAD/FMN-containing dehydrogenase